MGRNAAQSTREVARSLHYLRKRSQHRMWWSSARVALQRGQSGEPSNNQKEVIGKRV